MNIQKLPTTKWLMAFVMLAAIGLSACGFHLRGAGQDMSSIGALYIASADPYGKVTKDLKRILESSNAKLLESPAGAQYTLYLLKEEQTRRVLSFSAGGRPLEYEVYLGQQFHISDQAGEEVVPQNTISQTRSYVFDEANVLGKRSEEARLLGDMRRSVVQQLMRRLLALSKSSKQG